MSVISHQLVGNQGNTYAITKNHKKRYPSLESGELFGMDTQNGLELATRGKNSLTLFLVSVSDKLVGDL